MPCTQYLKKNQKFGWANRLNWLKYTMLASLVRAGCSRELLRYNWKLFFMTLVRGNGTISLLTESCTHFFLGQICPSGERCNEVNLMWSTNPWNKARPFNYTGNSGNSVPYSLRRVRGFFNVPCWLYNTEDAVDGAYDLSSLSEKTRTSYHLQMSLQKQHVLLSFFKTLSVSPVWGSNPRPPAQQSGALPTELTSRRFRQKRVSYRLTNVEEKYPGTRSFNKEL